MARGPLLRVRLLKLGEQEHVLLRTLHHIVSDGWSEGVFHRELQTLYEAFSAGGENPLAPMAVQYADFAIWQRRWLAGDAILYAIFTLVGKFPALLGLLEYHWKSLRGRAFTIIEYKGSPLAR